MTNKHRNETYISPSAEAIIICPESILCQSSAISLENMSEQNYEFTF